MGKNGAMKMKTITRMFRIPVSNQRKLDEILERYHGHETKVYCKDGWISLVIYDYPGGCTYNGEVVW